MHASEHDIYALRNLFGRYVRLRLAHPDDRGQTMLKHFMDRGDLAAFLQQFAADVEHSDLLIRLLKGEDPYAEPTDVPWRAEWEKGHGHVR